MSEDVKEACARFYAALNQVVNGDASAMMDVWAHDVPVSTSHPMGDWLHGWGPISASWEEFAQAIERGEITSDNLDVQVIGEVALCTCVEHVTLTMGGKALTWHANATNVFRRIGGAWKMIHHHSDKAPSFEGAA